MPLMVSKQELVEVVGGRSFGGGGRISSCGVVTDSREVKGGELFVALPGEKTHGHAFVTTAFERGAAMVLVETEEMFAGVDPERCVVVSSTLAALGVLAAWWRAKHPIPVLGVTGSVGKTTTKELCACILLAHSQGTYSRKSFNNHVGVPLSLAAIGSESEWAIIEMGMNHAGEIRALTGLARPSVAMITAIAPAHIENLGSIENIVLAKLEIAEGLPTNGPLILNGDHELLVSMANQQLPQVKKRFFGSSPSHDLRLLEVSGRGIEGISVTVEMDGERPEPFVVPIMGKHNGMNIAGSILATKTLIPDLSWETIRLGLSRFVAPDMRLRVHLTPSGVQVVDDSYNANPESMRALLEIARETSELGREVGLVLGDMLELGEFSEDAHRVVGRTAAGINPLFLIAVGPQSQVMAEEAERSGAAVTWYPSAPAAAQAIAGYGCDVLFVKASRGTRLDEVVRAAVHGLHR